MFKEARKVMAVILLISVMFAVFMFFVEIVGNNGVKGLWIYLNSPTAYFLKY